MSLNNTAETNLLKLLLQNVNWANVGDATGLRGSSTAGSVYVSLHTADPGETGSATTSEATYTGYARKAVTRDTSNWTVTGDTGSNTNAVTFDPCTAGSNTVTYFGISDASSGAGNWLLSGAISSPGSGLAVSAGISPNFAAGVLTITAN